MSPGPSCDSIVQRLAGEIDGVPLSRFAVGSTYEVGTALGSYLLALGAAVPIIDDEPILSIPNGRQSASNKIRKSRNNTRKPKTT